MVGLSESDEKGTLAKEWTAGYTLTLDKYSTDWTEIAKKRRIPGNHRSRKGNRTG